MGATDSKPMELTGEMENWKEKFKNHYQEMKDMKNRNPNASLLEIYSQVVPNDKLNYESKSFLLGNDPRTKNQAEQVWQHVENWMNTMNMNNNVSKQDYSIVTPSV